MPYLKKKRKTINKISTRHHHGCSDVENISGAPNPFHANYRSRVHGYGRVRAAVGLKRRSIATYSMRYCA